MSGLNEFGRNNKLESQGAFGSGSSLVFAKRKKSAFKGPSLNTSPFGHGLSGGPGTPGLRPREDSGPKKLGIGRSISGRSRSRNRGSVLIEEDEEEGLDEDEEDVEEVDAFSPVVIRRGESVHSIMVWDDPRPETASSSGVGTDEQLTVPKARSTPRGI